MPIPETSPLLREGPQTFRYFEDAKEWLDERGMVRHPVSDDLKRRIYEGNDLSGWAEIAAIGGVVHVFAIENPYDDMVLPDIKPFSEPASADATPDEPRLATSPEPTPR